MCIRDRYSCRGLIQFIVAANCGVSGRVEGVGCGWEMSGCSSAELVERRTGTPLTQVRFPGAARDFSPRVNFQCRLSHGVRITPCSTACNNICAHVKDPVVHVKVRWTMKTLKHPACTVGWVGRLCHSWLFPGNATRIFYWNDTGVN